MGKKFDRLWWKFNKTPSTPFGVYVGTNAGGSIFGMFALAGVAAFHISIPVAILCFGLGIGIFLFMYHYDKDRGYVDVLYLHYLERRKVIKKEIEND